MPVIAEYKPVAFSDHMAHNVTVNVPDPLTRKLSPECKPQFNVREGVAKDPGGGLVYHILVGDDCEAWCQENCYEQEERA